MTAGEDAGVTPLTATDPVRVGGFRLLGVLGAGGMGQVYLGISPGERLAAVKLVHAEYATHPEFRARFRLEAEAARRVSGAFTAPIVGADPDAPRPWLAVLYLPALTLRDAIALVGPLPTPAVRALGAALAEALRSIHAARLVHRDLKPANILLTANGPMVIDFGIARALDGTRVTRTGRVVGSAGYMAPEQIVSGRTIGPAGDVFALGAVLTFAATGNAPFGRGPLREVVHRIVHDPPMLDAVPDELRPLIAQCLAKDPDARPAIDALIPRFDPVDLDTLVLQPLADVLRRRMEGTAALAAEQPPLPQVPQVPPVPPPGWQIDRGRRPPGPQSRVLTRRSVLVAGAGTAVLAGGAIAATTLLSGGSSPKASTPATTPGPTLPTVTKPTWSVTAPKIGGDGSFALIGDHLVFTDRVGVTSLSTADGTRQWVWDLTTNPYSGPVFPVGEASGPSGVVGSLIYGVGFDQRGRNGFLYAIDPVGNVASTAPLNLTIDALISLYGLIACAVTETTAIFTQRATTGGRVKSIVAYDLRTGAIAWTTAVQYPIDSSYGLSASSTFVTADANTCYLQDGQDTFAISLATYKQIWHARGTADPGVPTNLVLADGMVLVGSMHVCAVDPATGRIIWTSAKNWPAQGVSGYGQNFAAEIPTDRYAGLLTVVGQTAYFADGSNAVWAMDVHTGALKWQYTNDLLQVDGSGDTQMTTGFASEELVAVPYAKPSAGGAVAYGFQLLDAATGRALEFCLPPQTGTRSPDAWKVMVSGSDVYAYAPTTVCKYERLAL